MIYFYKAKATQGAAVVWISVLLLAQLGGLRRLNGQTLDELLKTRTAKTIERSPETEEAWRQMLAAFVSNEEEKARLMAEKMLSQKQVLTPLQIRATQMLVDLASNVMDRNDSTEVAQLKQDALEALNAGNFAERQLARVSAEMTQMPKQFTAGGPTHQKWNHLTNEEHGYTANRDAAKKKYAALKTRYEELTKDKTNLLEESLVNLATALSDEDQIDGAIALCNVYIRKKPPAEVVVKKGQDLVLIKDAYNRAKQLLQAVESTVRKLVADKKLWEAQSELTKSRALIEARIEDAREKHAFAKLIEPLDQEMTVMISQSKAKALEIKKLAKSDPDEALRLLDVLKATAIDNPDIDDAGAAIRQKDKQTQGLANDRRIQVIVDLAQTDLNAAKSLFNDLQTSLSGEDAIILKAQLNGAKRGIWSSELGSIRADVDLAHSFLEKVSSNFLYTLKNGNEGEIRAALTTYEAKENMTRAKGLLVGAHKALDFIPVIGMDAVLVSRLEGLKATALASLTEIERAEALGIVKEDSSGPMVGLIVFVIVMAALVFFLMTKKKVIKH
ncbi:hypothetical protein [Prosthecobacter sp.]|uniref:hypothetical protein n=1 Tax=Prosthecobacter sp. TaxID=1965333 RepID=UPI0024878E88|nr:hypothetical protein [Prosthecobacter sp.]MDI1314585.1 hypothetical protein [Prosthecobacter sp.]